MNSLENNNPEISENFNSKVNRYKNAVEALQKLTEKDNEIEAVKQLTLYLVEQIKNIHRQNYTINNIEVNGDTKV